MDETTIRPMGTMGGPLTADDRRKLQAARFKHDHPTIEGMIQHNDEIANSVNMIMLGYAEYDQTNQLKLTELGILWVHQVQARQRQQARSSRPRRR